MDKLSVLLLGTSLDEKLLRKAPIDAIRVHLKSLNLRMLRMELIILGFLGYDAFVR